MNFNMKNRTIALTSAILFSAATTFAANAQESVVNEQKSLLEKLDSLQASVLGLKLNGTAKAGAIASIAESDQFSDDSPTHETQAFTDVNLFLTARPSNETMVTLQLRMHKDWQSAFDENNNPLIGHWFSYDGSILNNHIDFNLGYMRVGMTPLTLFAPQPLLLQEPEIFSDKRVDALAQRNLDTTSRRLLQGINVDYHSRELGIIDDIHAQVTGARLRNTAKKTDQLFFDFDFSDRYFYAGRFGVGLFGANVGVNYTDVFDRELTRQSHALEKNDTVYYEDNSVVSFELGFDSKKILPSDIVKFGLNGEFAMSKLESKLEYMGTVTEKNYSISENTYVDKDGNTTPVVYVSAKETSKKVDIQEDFLEIEGTSFYVTPYVKASVMGVEADLNLTYLKSEKDFWSEMASAPNLRGGSIILNSNAIYSSDVYSSALSTFGMSSLENMYMAVYNSNPLNLTNLLTSQALVNALSNTEESQYLYSKVYNNYKNAHFYRNGYDASSIKYLELEQAMYALDPSVNMALPFGLATPDRSGFNVAFNATWNDAITLNAYFAQFKQDSASFDFATGSAIENTYTEYAVGLSVDVGRLVNLDRKILIQGSYDHASEDAFLKRSSDKIMAGVSVDVWGPIGIQAGVQMANKKFDNPLFINEFISVTKADEMFVLAGPRIKIAPNSYFTMQYGMLNDKMNMNVKDMPSLVFDNGKPVMDELTGEQKVEIISGEKELSINKNVIIADVTVNF